MRRNRLREKKGERPIDVISLLDALLAPHHRLVLTKTHARILCTTLRQSFLTLTTTLDWGIIWRYLYILSLVKYHCLIIKDVRLSHRPYFFISAVRSDTHTLLYFGGTWLSHFGALPTAGSALLARPKLVVVLVACIEGEEEYKLFLPKSK